MENPASYFDLRDKFVRRMVGEVANVWDIIPALPGMLDDLTLGKRRIKGKIMPGAEVADGPLYIGTGSVVEPGAYISSSAFIGDNVRIRHGAYLRENCIFLNGSVLGHASEAKSAMFLPGAKAPHFAYVGDSVLGHHVNLGAGTKISNLRILGGVDDTIKLDVEENLIDTGLRKFGAILGDRVQVGCNAVLNPGCLMRRGCVVYAGTVVPKGIYDADTLIKLRQSLEMDAIVEH
jgi:bifunctional N-acetylglucosamine-1-phosphate-uridyltransferase/glucosamine-1-phosphate-acetyltransferase GlmU-like protein